MSEEMNDQMQVRRQKLQELIDLGLILLVIDSIAHLLQVSKRTVTIL